MACKPEVHLLGHLLGQFFASLHGLLILQRFLAVILDEKRHTTTTSAKGECANELIASILFNYPTRI